MIDHLQAHWLGLGHVLTALASLLLGGAVLLLRKGDKRHRWVGRAYLGVMAAMNGLSLMVYEFVGAFGPFHWMALVSLATLAGGYFEARRRRPGWRTRHAYFMAGSYVGLVAALAAEIATRVPGWSFGVAAVTSSGLVIMAGLILMFRLLPRLTAPGSG